MKQGQLPNATRLLPLFSFSDLDPIPGGLVLGNPFTAKRQRCRCQHAQEERDDPKRIVRVTNVLDCKVEEGIAPASKDGKIRSVRNVVRTVMCWRDQQSG